MRRLTSTVVLFALVFVAALPARPAAPTYTDSGAAVKIRWPSRTIKLAFSTSLNSPGPNYKLGTDVLGAARRALSRWSSMTDISFVITESTAQSISPGSAGDGISLITIADTPANNAIFIDATNTGKTRIFYDRDSGLISEADIVVNPHPVSASGEPLQFSTDGTAGTYDLESTFTHEIGHLIGLEHSTSLASTMHEHQALNGLSNHSALNERTLSEDDCSRVRELYGTNNATGSIEGTVTVETDQDASAQGIQIWLEEKSSGRLIASTRTSEHGEYQFSNLNPNSYRLIAAASEGGKLSLPWQSPERPVDVRAAQMQQIDVTLRPQTSSTFLSPKFIGTDSELSSTPVEADAGQRITIYVAGQGLDQVLSSGVSITSPFFAVHPETMKVEPFRTSFPVISFEVTVAQNVPFGDYNLRLQSTTGEVAYMPGAITIDPGVDSSFANPVDDARFFVRQHYTDFLGREADAGGLNYWTEQLERCGQDVQCLRTKRLAVSAAFSREPEFQRKGVLLYQLYAGVLGRRPLFAEFISDRQQLSASAQKQTLIYLTAFVQRPEFMKKYPATLAAKDFVDSLVGNVLRESSVDLTGATRELVAMFDGTVNGRVAILGRVLENEEFRKAESDKAFVVGQYFNYLLRDPDEAGYAFWLQALQSKGEQDGDRYTPLVCAFLNSNEYQSRFGMLMTHSVSECR